jgi:tRNA(adenine34) deaminase
MNNPSDNHIKFMREALIDARIAFDHQEFPVGCVLVHEDQIIARGRRIHSIGKEVLELDHAEIVALRNLAHSGLSVPMDQVIAYSTMEPCLMCYPALLLNGIRHIIYAYEDVMGGSTSMSLTELAPLYREMSVTITPHVLRSESLELFKTFFKNPDNNYWKDSLLARYTLEQP